MAKGRGAGSLSSGELAKGARAATGGIHALGSAFDDLSKKGEISSQSINQFASSVAAVNPLLGVLVAAVGVTVGSFQRLKELDLKDSLVQLGAGVKVAVNEFDRFVDRTTAGAGESGALKEKLKDLAEAQGFLRQHIAAVNAEAIRQTELAKTQGADADTALRRVESEIELEKSRVATAAAVVDAMTAEIEALRKRKAEQERAAKTQKDFNESIANEREIFEAKQRGRGTERQVELKELEMLAAQYDRQYDIEVKAGDANVDVTAKNIRNVALRIDALEQEIQSQQRLGQMAEQAIGGVAAAAFDQYANAVDRVIDGQNAFNKGSGRALQNATSNIMKQVGREAAVYAVMETAKGIAASTGPAGLAAFGDPSGHFAAAATFASVAALAGVSAGALSVKGGNGGGSGGGNGGGGGSGDAGSPSGGPHISVVVIGSLDTQARKDLAAQLAEEFAQGGG